MRILKCVFKWFSAAVFVLAVAGMGCWWWLFWSPRVERSGRIKLPGLESEVTIIRDKSGMPHIKAENIHDLMYAFGYISAADRLFQMDMMRRASKGELAELLGRDMLEYDLFQRRIGIPEVSLKQEEQAPKEIKSALEAYSAGINAYIRTHRHSMPIEFRLLGYAPQPWRPADSFAIGKFIAWELCRNFNAEVFVLKLLKQFPVTVLDDLIPAYSDDDSPLVSIRAPKNIPSPTMPDHYYDVIAALGLGMSGVGSNNWVIGPQRSASGHPIVANDPHLGLMQPAVMYPAHLMAEAGSLDVIGVAVTGTPAIIIGHNRFTAWGMTNVGGDVQDLFVHEFNKDNPALYRGPDGWEKAEIIPVEIKVKEGKGIKIHKDKIVKTRLGPIVFNDPAPLSLLWTGQEITGEFQALWGIDLSKNVNDIVQALRTFDTGSQNLVFADVQGHFGFLTAGKFPIRLQGQGMVPLEAWDPQAGWTGQFIPFEDLPQAIDPDQGYVATANARIYDSDYPYFIFRVNDLPHRFQRISSLIEAEAKLDLDDMKRIQSDIFTLTGTRVRDAVLDAYEDEKTQDTLDEAGRNALLLLARWDGNARAESPAPAIVFVAFKYLNQLTFQDELGEKLYYEYLYFMDYMTMAMMRLLDMPDSRWFDDVSTRDKVETRDEIARNAFMKALSELKEKFGSDINKWQWGGLHATTLRHPFHEGPKILRRIFDRGPYPDFGTFDTINNRFYYFQKSFETQDGPAIKFIADLGDLDHALYVVSSGASGHRFSRHYSDQFKLWKTNQYLPMPFAEKDVESVKEAVIRLVPGK